MQHYHTSQWACMEISILFNNTDCASPAPIYSGAFFRQYQTNYYSRFASPSIVSGECTQLKRGPMKITVKAELKCYTGNAYLYNGYNAGFSNPLTYTLRVEERCQSDQD